MIRKLSDISEFIIDTKHNTPEYADEGYPCIRTPNIGCGYFDLDNVRYVSETTYEKWTERAAPKEGDLILAREAPVGNVAWIPPGLKVCIGQRTVLIRPLKEIVDSRYLNYYLLSDECQNRMHSLSGGATVAHLNMSDIRAFEVHELPTMIVQKQIAAILSAYDDLIENNLRRIKILEEMAQNLYREWFVNFRFPGHEQTRFVDSPLGRIPEGWVVKCLKDLLIFKNNGTKAGKHLNNLAYLPIDLLPRKSLAISEVKSWEEAKSSLHLFEEGDCLFGAMRPYFHKVVEAPLNGVTRKTCFVFASKNSRYRAFALLTLFQESTVDYANSHSKGATIPYAVWSNSMDKMQFIMPPEKYADMFESMVSPMLSRIKMIYHLNKNLRQTRDLLLPKLISGEVDVSGLDINVPEEAIV